MGVAAAAYQTEGAWNLDGKGKSNWDHFSRIRGKIENGENADVAADFYHRYAEDTVPMLRKLKSLYEEGDEEKMAFDFDFIGLQYYYRTIAKKSMMPGMRAKEIIASKRGVPVNVMGGEIYPEGLYQILKKFSKYKGIRNLIITENGTCVPDKLENEKVHDKARIDYFRDHLAAVLKARREGVNVNGYFVWSPTDNFEWDKGYTPRFGLVYFDFKTLERYIKDSGLWFREFLR